MYRTKQMVLCLVQLVFLLVRTKLSAHSFSSFFKTMTGRSSVPFPVDSATLADVLPAASDFVLSTGMVSRRWVGHIDTIAHILIFSSLFFSPLLLSLFPSSLTFCVCWSRVRTCWNTIGFLRTDTYSTVVLLDLQERRRGAACAVHSLPNPFSRERV